MSEEETNVVVVELSELELLEGELDQIEKVRQANNAELKSSRKLEATKRAIADKKALARAESEHGEAFSFGTGEKVAGRKIAVVETDGGLMIFKRPDPHMYKKWTKTKMEEEDNITFAKQCLVHPDRRGFNQIIEDFPGTITRASAACAELGGARLGEILGKSQG